MTKQAAIYARVSTDDQAERGYSLPSQIEACEKFAGQKGLQIGSVFADDISGTVPIAQRPEGGQLQEAISTRLIGTVIVYQVDRLSRDIVDLLTTVRDWIRAGVQVYALDIGQVTSELDIVLVVKAWQGGDEGKKIVERTTRGRNAKARAGRVVGVGTAPFGYQYANGELVIDERQARIVRMVFDWYVNEGLSLVRIARRLTEMCIPTPAQVKGVMYGNARHGFWYQSSVNNILLSETYAGVLRYGKYIGEDRKGGKRPIDEQIAIPVPAIVSREIFDLAQKRRAYNSKVARRKMKRDYLLRGLIYCNCGHRLTGSDGDYRCWRRYAVNGATCKEPEVPGRRVENITWGYVMRLLLNADEFEQALHEAQALEAEQLQPKQRELDHVLALITDTEHEAETVAIAIKQTKGIVNAKLQRDADEIDRRYQAFSKRKAELEAELQSELTDATICSLMEFRECVAVGMNNLTNEERRAWLEALQTKVTVCNGNAVVTCRLSTEAFTYPLFEYSTR